MAERHGTANNPPQINFFSFLFKTKTDDPLWSNDRQSNVIHSYVSIILYNTPGYLPHFTLFIWTIIYSLTPPPTSNDERHIIFRVIYIFFVLISQNHLQIFQNKKKFKNIGCCNISCISTRLRMYRPSFSFFEYIFCFIYWFFFWHLSNNKIKIIKMIFFLFLFCFSGLIFQILPRGGTTTFREVWKKSHTCY